MQIAISNLAWDVKQDSRVATLLQKLSIRHIELAPTKIWTDPSQVTESAAQAYRAFWNSNGVEILALQSLLFGRPDLALFANDEVRSDLMGYLTMQFRLAQWLGATRLVFGSPKNRLRGKMPIDEANKVAADFFHRAGEAAKKHGVQLCIEPNAPAYGCDFITTAEEGARVVDLSRSPNVKLHLDWACMELAGDSPDGCLKKYGASLGHFHLSSPKLASIDQRSEKELDHILTKLNAHSPHLDTVSIEMLGAGEDLSALQKALEKVLACAQ